MSAGHLFIGGSKDGEWDAVRGDTAPPTYQCVEHYSSILLSAPRDVEPTTSHTVEVYERSEWRTGDLITYIYIIDGMTPAQAFDKLLKGYKPRYQRQL